jgi:NAD(P)-dependent dehydrogenase (short-subunit alcohol dehydrogenase family)
MGMTIDYSGRNVVVTGATGELGESVARALLAAGATVHVPARTPDKAADLYAADKDRVRVAAVADLGDEAAVEAFYAELPPLWASIHCAGGFAMSPFEKTSLADLAKMLHMNAFPAFLCCREAVKAMRPRGGRIVNVAAQPGVEPRRGAGMVSYAASKAAVAAITLALAEEVASEGIWVNAVVPSIMDTAANRRAMPKADFSKWAKLDEVAATIAFLASPQNTATRAALVPVYGRS